MRVGDSGTDKNEMEVAELKIVTIFIRRDKNEQDQECIYQRDGLERKHER